MKTHFAKRTQTSRLFAPVFLFRELEFLDLEEFVSDFFPYLCVLCVALWQRTFLQNEPKTMIFHTENKGRINMNWKLQNEPKFFGFANVIPATCRVVAKRRRKAGIQTSVNMGIIYFINLCVLGVLCGEKFKNDKTNPNKPNCG